MKVTLLLPALLLFMGLTACKKSSSPRALDGAVLLGDCKTEVIGSEEVTICYDALVNDSRCPEGGYCIWEGLAIGKFTFKVNTETHTFNLATMKFTAVNRDTVIANYKIHLENIDPYPGEKRGRPSSALVWVTRH
jgi:hypothetical protein